MVYVTLEAAYLSALLEVCYNTVMARLSLRLFCVIPALLLLCCRQPAGAEPPVLLLVASTHASYVFPTAHLLSDDTPLMHTFLLRNGTKRTLAIARVAASCECIQAEIGGSTQLPVQAAPGAVVPVKVRLSSRRLLPGPFSRSVWLYWPGGPRDGLRLELRGTVRDDTAPTGT